MNSRLRVKKNFGSTFSRFRAQFKACMLERLSSRGAIAMMFTMNTLMLVMAYFFWNAFSSSSGDISGGFFTKDTLLTYTVVSVILRSLIVTFGVVWRVGGMITDGSICGILLKPVGFLEYWMFQQISRLIYSIFVLTIPLVIFTFISMPNLFSSNLHFVPFILSSIIGFYISTLLNISMGLMGFWTEKTEAVHQLNMLLYTLASGTLIPLAIYPSFIRKIVGVLPYASIIDTPLTILIKGDASLIYIQLIWAVILTIGYSVLYKKGSKRLEVVGI